MRFIPPGDARALRASLGPERGHLESMLLRTTTALPYEDTDRAASGLRGQLRLMAIDRGLAVEWSTLEVDEPTSSSDPRGRTWYEWSASVEVIER